MAGLLSVVATPIGNLGDMTARALEVLAAADVVCAEDTRVTGKLLAHFGIEAHLERCDENVIARRAPELVERLQRGERIAFCSDAGMPGVSDPGMRLVDAAREAGMAVEVLPGACAVTAALVAAGFGGTAFYFGGFLPRKSGRRQAAIEAVADLDAALVFYESPRRAVAAVQDMATVLGAARKVALCRELTKLHEEVLRLPAGELADELSSRRDLKGELVLVVAPPDGPRVLGPDGQAALDARITRGLAMGKSKSALARELVAESGLSRNEMYARVLELANTTETGR